MAKVRLLFFLLGVIGPGGGTLLFDGLPNSTTIRENTPAGTRVYSFSVNSTVGLFVTPEIINSSPLTTAFRVDSSPPLYYVVVTGNPVLDFETMPNSFELQIYMEDSSGTTQLQILTVQLTNVNEPPVFLGNLANQVVTVYIVEGSPIGPIYRVLASDPEDLNPLQLSLAPASAPFTVPSTAPGDIRSTKVFDYETDPHSYTLTVTVTDSGGLSVNGSVIVYITNINDETPYFTITNTSFSIPEEQSPGTILTTITAVDPDAAGFVNTLYYSITTPNQYFSINELTGTIQIAKTIDRDAGPFRLNPFITLEIKVIDRPGTGQANSTRISITIQDINDNPPVCAAYAFSVAVSENASYGSLIYDLSNMCKDIDVDTQNNVFNFTGLSGLGSNQRFQLDPSGSGKIVLIGNLDFENPNNIAVGNEYSLTVSVQDIAYPYYSQNIYVYVKTIPVDEYPPVFNSSSYVFNISELSPPSTMVGQVYATEADYPYIGITYTLVAGGSTQGAISIFWLNPTTGQLLLANYADYETTPKYQLTIQATDSASKTSTTSVTVNILEANDEKPICKPNSYTLSVPVTQATGTNIQNFKLTCEDRDSGPTSFQYFINSGNINNHFTFSPTAGSNVSRLILANPFDYTNGGDQTWNYKLLVYITDGNLISSSPQPVGLIQTGTVTLYINVYIPGLTTTITTTTPRVIYVVNKENVYSGAAWYVPFVATVGCLLLLGLLGLLGYLIAKYCPCRTTPKPDTEMLIKPVEKKLKQDVVWEMTKMNTVFDGEAIDPITGNVYEYNTKSGARRWKDTKQPIMTPQGPQQTAVGPADPTAPPPTLRGTPNKTEKTPTREDDGKNATKPATPKRLQTPNQTSPIMQPGSKSPASRAPVSPRLYPKVSPKIPQTPIQ
ncbi:cadherin-related family member 3 [Rana temporaria]|uniref:cadherin-related family member 3 n=1 Tax=Rana temporaria TaxID=8407 RepID=UPI001AADA9B1|nr:cadherin-related family member 3 [Rana temporaria]